MNTEAMFSSKTDLWATPKDFFDRLDAEFGFTLDACALPENAKCKTYYTPEQDGLAQPWEGVVWCNPPYGRQIGQWVKKAHDTATRGGLVVMLLPARYEEMRYTMNELKNGRPESECYEAFGRRCESPVYRKFGMLLSQNLRKGTKGLTNLLQREAQEAFEERKNMAKKLGEEAGTKLMIPLFLMLAVVFVVVTVPAFLTIQI